MCIARQKLINLNKTRYYHCSSRIVRRSFLCGYDSLTKKNYNYRRNWIIKRIRLLSENYAIEVCAYAIMSNHYHLVLKVNLTEGIQMTSNEVVQRWTAVHPSKKELRNMYGNNGKLLDDPYVRRTIRLWRRRLMSISWFMSALNYNISRKANKEDGCKGHFWDGRFASQPLIGNEALLNCMAYVDLNPIRAGVANNLLECHFTSLKERIEALSKATSKILLISKSSKLLNDNCDCVNYQPYSLTAFALQNCFSIIDYLKLVDLKARQARADKKGFLKSNVKPILSHLGLGNEVLVMLKRYCNDSTLSFLFNSRIMKIRDIGLASMFG